MQQQKKKRPRSLASIYFYTDELAAIDQFSFEKKISRNEVILEAISDFIAKHNIVVGHL